MEFKTHNQTNVNINDTSFMGEIGARYSDLVTAFGEPTEGDSYKVDAAWEIEFADGTVATIYNWKNGPNYLGASAPRPPRMTSWHVGGLEPSVLVLVHEALAASRQQKLAA